MSDFLYNERRLSSEDLEGIYQIIDSDGCYWEDGIKSVVGGGSDEDKRETKSNLQCIVPYFEMGEIKDILFPRFDNCAEFYYYALSEYSANPTISRTEAGGYYKPHHDHPSNGHFSTTVWLNDDYDGGELCLWLNGEERKFKPPAGSTVTYRTGTPHMVAEVTRGRRDVMVFWTKTKIKDSFLAYMYSNLIRVEDLIEHTYPDTLEEASKTPCFILRNMINAIERNHLLFKDES